MEIRIYNQILDLVGIIENQTSLLWIRKYFEPGEFELYAPMTEFNISILKIGNIVTMYGQNEAGIIEDIELEESITKNTIVAKGRFLSAYMGYRLIRGTVNINSTIEAAMRRLLSEATPIPLVELGALNGFSKTIEGQVNNKNLLKFMTKLAKAGNIGFNFRPDFNAKKIVFETYMGTDKSIAQSDNNRVIFSESYDNLNSAKYRANDKSYANVAYVDGKDANEQEVSLIVGDTASAGLERREIFVDGSSVNPLELTRAQYIAALKQEAQNTINARSYSEAFECDTNAQGNFIYRRNYDLGDIVTVKKESWGIKKNLRITEIQETYEYGQMIVSPTFGNPMPTAMDWED